MELETKSKKNNKKHVILQQIYNESNIYEFGLDEAGRGCLFGPVFVACVVLPKDSTTFDGKNIKDSKKFSSKKKIMEVAEYIKQHAVAWNVTSLDESEIDKINILESSMRGMHKCLDSLFASFGGYENIDKCLALVDGNYFNPYSRFDIKNMCIKQLPHITIEQGDSKYMAIAAASILAKTARDYYISELCEKYPELVQRYGLHTNMGYGTKRHLDGIRQYGISQWHRRTFGDLCKSALLNPVLDTIENL
jgi:ribonuclease HII